MASRLAVQQQNRGEAGGGGGGRQKKMVAEERNRRALGDIGNVIVVGEMDIKQLARPVTRGLSAKLLANGQIAAPVENKKKVVPVKVDKALGDKRAAVTKAKVMIKPKPVEVIEISPDTEEQTKKEKPLLTHSSRKKPHTFTEVLTARSKAACGLIDKAKEQIVDIDAADINNELAVVEYVEDIYKFYKLVEHENRVSEYMDSQPEINERMRAILVDWLIEVHNKFTLMSETLYLTINIVDRFLALKAVSRKELQLLGISAMLIASKYEEIWATEVNDLVCISDRAYTHEQVLKMEKLILGVLEWNLTVPTPYMFLVRFIKASISDHDGMENMVYFLAELGMMNYPTTIMYCPSMLAASAVYAARCTLGKIPAWNDTLKLHTGFSEPQLMECAKLLVSFHSTAADSKLRVIFRKYSKHVYGAVALHPPAKSLLAAS